VRKVADKGVWPFVRSLSYINKLSPEEKEVRPASVWKLRLDYETTCGAIHERSRTRRET
jgi:hypothetical protein